MIPTLTLITGIVLAVAKIATLIWVFYRTKRSAAIAYLTYLLIDWLFLQGLISRAIERVQNNESMMWLGAASGERATNFLYLARIISDGIETALLIWLLLSLMRRIRSA